LQIRIGKAQAQAAPRKGTNWENIRILAIDDDPLILLDLKGIVEHYGASCDVAICGEDALKLVETNGAYDFYFVDWLLPGVSGVDLSKTFKYDIPGPKEPAVIMISSSDYGNVNEKIKKAGIDRFMKKPLFASQIIDVVNEFTGGAPHEDDQDLSGIYLNYQGRRILLAEDVEINREIVIGLLEPTMVEIECAENGREAVDMFRAAPDKYDMIFMDIQMPELDGYEATRQIRALDARRAKMVPIIAMTANVFREDVEKCFEAGMNDHIGKPFDIETVMDKLKIYLPGTS
jgi:CheY-like chemotaxis protein